MVCWSALSEAIPLYPLYALLFTDSGLSVGQVSLLFAVWSGVGFVAEVPCGAWADRHSRRTAIVLGGVLQAAGYAAWTVAPAFAAFAVGFVLWGLGGALTSGSVEALVHDGLSEAGAGERYAGVMGRLEAAALLVQVPLAILAGALFAVGGYALVGWVSVGVCLSASLLASRLPETRPATGDHGHPRLLAVLRDGVREVHLSASLRGAVLALAVLAGFDGIEEYTPILAAAWGVPTGVVPLALLAIPLAGAIGALAGQRAVGVGPIAIGAGLLAGAALLAAAQIAATPAGLAGVAVFYGLYRLVVIVVDARMQARIAGGSRATVTSLAALGGEVASLALFAAWALGGLTLVTALVAVAAIGVSAALGGPGRGR